MNGASRYRQGGVSVLHSMNVWLSQTMTWLFTQVSNLPEEIDSHIVADATDNLEQFPIENLTSADRDHRVWRALGRVSWQIAKRRQKFLLQREMTLSKAQVLHSHFGDRGWGNIDFAERNELKHVVTFYGYDASRLPVVQPEWRDRYSALFESADLFLCEGPHLAKTLQALGCDERKVRVHHLGIPVDHIEFVDRSRPKNKPLRVLIAGTFVQKKGIPLAIEALGRAMKDIELEITLVGDSNGQARSDEEKARIESAIDESGLRGQVKQLGYQPHQELLRLAYDHHIFLSPSIHADDGDSEGGAPVSLIEMAATGIQIISSTHCDIPNVVIDKKTGLLAGENSVDELQEKILWLAGNPDQWPGLAGNARIRIESEFNSVAQGEKLGKIYCRLVNGKEFARADMSEH